MQARPHQPLPPRLLLSFADAATERRFVAFYTDTYLRFAQFSLGLGLVLVLGDFLADWLAFPEVAANYRRMTVCEPILLAGLVYSFNRNAKKYWEAAMTSLLVIVAAALFWILLAIDAEGGMGLRSWVGILNLAFLEFYCFVIIGVRFHYALVGGVLILAGFVVAMSLGFEYPQQDAAYWSYHVVTVAILAAGIGWWREFLLRKDFMAKTSLEDANLLAAESMRASNAAAHRRETALSLMEATLEATDNGILVIDRQGKVSSSNRRFARMWRIPDDLLASRDDRKILQHVLDQLVDPESFLQKVQALYGKPEVTSRDTLRFTDGRVFARFSHPQKLHGEIIGRVWSFLDVTDQYRAEQRVLQLSQAISDELERSEHARSQLQSLLSAIPDLVWMKDPSGIFLSCNPAFEHLMGAKASEILGKTDYDFFPEEIADAFRSDDCAAAESDSAIVREEWVTYRSDSHSALIETVKTAVRSQDGKLLGVLGVARDVTRARALLDELEQARSAAQHSNETKSMFLANMSHEIRTPMNAIVGMADLCLATALDDRQRNYMGKIKTASDALLHILNDILDFSKIEAGKLQMESTPFVLESVFDQLSSITALRAEKQGIELSYDIVDNNQLLIGDPLRLGQVLTNLVTNALKFSARGSVVVKAITERAAEGSVELHFSVSDQGIGMAPGDLAKLFRPFSQADASTSRRYGGTGLGLAISHHLVEMMGGRIWAESQAGVGSTFHFTARFATPGPDRRFSIETLAAKLAGQSHRPIMVVDDNPVARRVLEYLVGQLGLQVHVVDGGEAALELATAPNAPSYLACLVDWRMPGIDGIETIRRLRTAFVDRGIDKPPPMILVTAYSHHDELQEIGHRVDGLLAKPVSMRQLHLELARCLGLATAAVPPYDRRKADGMNWERFSHLDILLAEDNEVNREVISELLAGVGIRVRLADNGAEVINEVARKVPDLILMDCQMPVLDGYMATQWLRDNPAWQDLPIIALTANAMPEDLERSIAAGMNAHVAKPIRMEMLYAALEKCVASVRVEGTRPAPAAPAAPPTGELPDFPCIDVAAALIHLDGRLPLLLRVLKHFRDNQGANFECQYAEALAARNWKTAKLLAHSLKGVARTAGANDLGEAARQLESATAAADGIRCAELLGNVMVELERVTAGLSGLDRVSADSLPPPTTAAARGGDCLPRLALLAEMLAGRDTASVDLVLDIAPLFAGTPQRSAWAEIAAAVEAYDFGTAQAGLERLCRTLATAATERAG